MLELNKKNINRLKDLFPSASHKGDRFVKAVEGRKEKIKIKDLKKL